MRPLMLTIFALLMAAALCGLGAQASAGSRGADVLPLPAKIGSVQIIKPDASVPAPYARFAGVWGEGSFFEGKWQTSMLIIRSVSAEGHVTGILLGSGDPKPWSVYLSGKIEGNGFPWKNPSTGTYFMFAMNKDDSVTIDRFIHNSGRFAGHFTFTMHRVPETAWPKGVSVAESAVDKAKDLDYFLHYKAPGDN